MAPTPSPMGGFNFNPVQGTPGRRGLLEVATTPQLPEGALARLGQGGAFLEDSCAALGPLPVDLCLGPADDYVADPADWPRSGQSAWRAIGLVGADRCSAMSGVPGDPERRRRAEANLRTTRSWQAEREFSDGAATTVDADPNPYLTDGNSDPALGPVTDTITTAATQPAYALAVLERELGSCLHGGRGMIHATPDVVALWVGEGVVRVDGGALLTPSDHVVVSGAGYSGNDPDGDPAAAGSSWAYATPPVYAILGPVLDLAAGEAPGLFDPTINDVITRVYQLALVFHARCCRLAAQVATVPPS